MSPNFPQVAEKGGMSYERDHPGGALHRRSSDGAHPAESDNPVHLMKQAGRFGGLSLLLQNSTNSKKKK